MKSAIKNNISSFCGIIKNTKNRNTLIGFDNVERYENLDIGINKGKFELKNLYKTENNIFIWTGGFNAISNPADFNYKSYDKKFIYIKVLNEKVIIYTDHYSRIPLYYYKNKDQFLFSTSLQLLYKNLNTLEFSINNDSLLFYYNFGFMGNGQSLIKSISSLPANKKLTFSTRLNTLKIISYRKYINKNIALSYNDLHENASLLNDNLYTSTKETIKNFKKIGISISGGVDSGYLAQKLSQCKKDFSAYTVCYKDTYNEIERVDYIAEKLSFSVKKIIIDEHDIIKNFLKCSETLSAPMYFNNSILNFVYEHASKDDIDIIFDGDGVDRIFLGSNGFLRLNIFLKMYKYSKYFNFHKLIPLIIKKLNFNKFKKLIFHFNRYNEQFPFYGGRILTNFNDYDTKFEKYLNKISVPNELNQYKNEDDWLFFSCFALHYIGNLFFHDQYELQLQQKLVSNPHFFNDFIIDMAFSIPNNQKIYKNKGKVIIKEAAKINFNNKYWELKKIGLDNAFSYIYKKKHGYEFINDHVNMVIKTDEYMFLKHTMNCEKIDPRRLIPFIIWKQNICK